MRFAPTRAPLWAVLVLAAGACSRGPAVEAGSPPAAGAGGQDVAAELNGTRILSSEVEQRAAAELSRLRQEDYDARKAAIDQIVEERLLDQEAARRGLTREGLIKAEVEDKLPAPSKQRVAEVYQQLKPRLGGMPLEQVAPDIERQLRAQGLAELRQTLVAGLRAAATVRVHLEPPRAALELPVDAPADGPAGAPVTIVEYLDYQCGYCRRVEPTLEELLKRNPGKVRLVVRDFPISARNVVATRAARCAGEQGKFWEYHRGLFARPSDLSDADLRSRAAELSLDGAGFASCLASDRHDASIRSSYDAGAALGVNSTPTFFINGRRVLGARPIEAFQQIIDEELARATVGGKGR